MVRSRGVVFHRDLTRDFHQEVTRLGVHLPPEPDAVKSLLCLFSCGGFGAGLEAEAVVSGFEDVAVVGEAIEQRGSHLGVAEDGSQTRGGNLLAAAAQTA